MQSVKARKDRQGKTDSKAGIQRDIMTVRKSAPLALMIQLGGNYLLWNTERLGNSLKNALSLLPLTIHQECGCTKEWKRVYPNVPH